MRDPLALLKRRQACTCTGSCQGPAGLGDGWFCALYIDRTAHDFYDREDGLKHCRVCGGAEGSLPTHCPGSRMQALEGEVYAGRLDFKDGAWLECEGEQGT